MCCIPSKQADITKATIGQSIAAKIITMTVKGKTKAKDIPCQKNSEPFASDDVSEI